MNVCRHDPVNSFGDTEQGIVLLLCLFFLTALMLLGLSASADTILQNQLVSNYMESQRVQQSAQTALRWAEHWLLDLDEPPPKLCITTCKGQLLRARGDLPAQPELEGAAWWQSNGQLAGIDPLSSMQTTTSGAANSAPSLWIIEMAHEVPASADGSTPTHAWYRILARASGRTKSSISIVESIVMRTWPTEKPGPCFGLTPGTECGRVSWRQLR